MMDYDVDSAMFSTADANLTNELGASIRGDTLLLGDIFANCKIRVYEKSSGRFLLQTKSDSNGKFVINHLQKGWKYTVICIPTNGENSKIFDNVIAI